MGKIFERILAEVKKIPPGQTRSYGDIARVVGCNPRVVGYAVHSNRNPKEIPCHRVVFSDGSLAPGYVFGGSGEQKKKLEKEKVRFSKEGKVIR